MFRPHSQPAQERLGDAGLPDWSSPALSLSPLLAAGRGGVGGYESPGCSRLLCAAGRRGGLELELETVPDGSWVIRHEAEAITYLCLVYARLRNAPLALLQHLLIFSASSWSSSALTQI